MKCLLFGQRPLKRKKALEKAYEEGFNYGYDCCAFAHNICGSQPEVLDEMSYTSKALSPKLFINPRCPPSVVPSEVASIDVHPGDVANAPERVISAQKVQF